MKRRHILLGSAAALTLSGLMASTAAAQTRVPAIEILTTTQAYDPIRYESAFIIADAWRELGLEVNITPLEFATLLGRFYDQHDFDATIMGWSGRVDRLDPQMFLGTLDSRQGAPGSNNAGAWSMPEYDALYDAQTGEFDLAERQRIVHEMQELYVPEAPVTVLYNRDEVTAYNTGTWTNMNAMAGEALYSEWLPMQAQPLTDRTVLRIGGPQQPDNLNPLASTSVWGWKWMRLYYDRLVRLTPDVEPQPWAAESVEAVNDTTIRVVLREGMTFHDGEPVTAEDVVFTFNTYVNSSYAYFNAYLAPLASVEAEDERTVIFNLSYPAASFASITLSQIPILPQHIWGSIENPEDLTPEDTPVVGSGPFSFVRFDRGEFMSIDRNDTHFNAPNIAATTVEFRIYADSEGVFTALQTGQIDLTAWRMEPGQIPLAEANPELTVVSVPDFGYYHLTFNTLREPFGDRAVRRALTYAMDRERMVNVLLDGRGEVGTSVIAPVNTFWHNAFVERFDYDMDAARAELEAAGYSWDAEGRLQR